MELDLNFTNVNNQNTQKLVDSWNSSRSDYTGVMDVNEGVTIVEASMPHSCIPKLPIYADYE